MKTLYEADNAVEAQMLAAMLRQAGFAPHVQGEHLQGAIGEIPAMGLVRLMIDEADYPRARALIDQWDRAQPRIAATGARATRAAGARPLMIAFTAGLLVGIAATSAVVGATLCAH